MGSMVNRLTWFGNGQNRRAMFKGTYAFTTTSTTKDVTIPLGRIESVHVRPIGTPGKVYRTITQRIGTVSATTSFPILTPPYAGTLIAAKITTDTTHAVDNANHWTFTLVNKGQAGSGSTNMIAATSVNSTDGDSNPVGSAITAFVARSLTLTATAADLVTAASDVLALVATKAGTATNLSGLTLELTFDMGDVGEQLTIDETISGTVGTDDARIVGSNGSTTVTVRRNATNPTSALKFFIEAIGY